MTCWVYENLLLSDVKFDHMGEFKSGYVENGHFMLVRQGATLIVKDTDGRPWSKSELLGDEMLGVPIPEGMPIGDYNKVLDWAEHQPKRPMVQQKEAAIPNPNELEREATEVIKAVASTLDELYLNNGSWNGCADIAPDFIKKLESKGFVIVAKT